MQISAFGHSCVLISFENNETNISTKILVDPWFSDHATGDLMSRFPRVRFDSSLFSDVDAVYLTHAHCDHLDPYTLMRLWTELETPPILILPESLSFLVPTLEEYVPNVDIVLLKAHVSFCLGNVDLLGFFDVSPYPNNEEDVMVLILSHHNERVLIEADARLSLDVPSIREFVGSLLQEPHLESIVYLTTENELTGTMEGRLCSSQEERQELVEYAFSELYASVEHLYMPVDDASYIWNDPRLLRLVHGQGLTAPHELDERWQNILFPVRIQDRVRIEREVSAGFGYVHQIEELNAGMSYRIHDAHIIDVQEIMGLELLDREERRIFDEELDFFPALPCAPLDSSKRDVSIQKDKILSLLNHSFLPYLHGVRNPSVLYLLTEHEGEYRIQMHYGGEEYSVCSTYALSFHHMCFTEIHSEEPPHEAYWANDIVDFLDGLCDEFSTFCRRQIPAPYMRLWAFLATPLMNSALQKKRIALHFERAKQGFLPSSWVLERY